MAYPENPTPYASGASVTDHPAAGTTPLGDAASHTPGNTRPEVLERGVQGAHASIDRLAETVAPHVQRLQEGLATASDQLHQGADRVTETGQEWADSLRGTVRQNPIAAVATALAVGVLISRLTRH